MNSILCFGEALWDCLPQGRFVGGAPLNVAFHLNQLGAKAFPVSAVGNDDLGHELLARLRQLKIDTRFVGVHASLPTGTVTATLDAQHNAHYTIHEGVAWDAIAVTDAVLSAASEADAIIYGTLAQRSVPNRHQLATLLERAAGAFKVCDVNLRPPYDAPERVWELAREADLIKLNDSEIVRLMDATPGEHTLESLARLMAEETGASAICVTAGAQGAGLLYQGDWFWADAQPIVVADTIGAGDAFLAALVWSLLEPDASPWESLHRACRLGEFVASQHGATPQHPSH